METPMNNLSENLNIHYLAFQHELKTPIQAILYACELLENTTLNHEQLKYISQLKQAANLLSDITHEISKKDQAQMKVFSIQNLIEQIQLIIAAKATQKELNFQVCIAERLPMYWQGFPAKVARILINLLDNAIKYTSNGYVKLCLTAIEEEGIQFTVKDSGGGIPEEQQEQVFAPLFQIDEAQQGTGLGLYFVNELVEQLKGNITVESTADNGTAVRVFIPMEVAENLIEEEVEQPLNDPEITILLVEDHDLSRMLLEQVIENNFLNATILSTKNGEEALAFLQRKSIDLVLLDIQMPVLDGNATLHAIKTQISESLPVIAVTAYELVDNHGFTAYLRKPFQPQALVELIEQHTMENVIQAVHSVSPIDLSYLDLMADGDKLLKQLMLEMLLEELPTEIEKMIAYYESKSWRELRGVSHRMKTTLSFIGNETLSKTNAHIEYYVKHEIHLDELPSLIEKIQILLPSIIKTLELEYEQLVGVEKEQSY